MEIERGVRTCSNLPSLKAQSVDISEMVVSRNERQLLLKSDSGYPNVIFWYRVTLFPKPVFYLAIATRHSGITSNDRTPGGKLIQSDDISLDLTGFVRAIIKLTQHDARNEYFGRIGHMLAHG